MIISGLFPGHPHGMHLQCTDQRCHAHDTICMRTMRCCIKIAILHTNFTWRCMCHVFATSSKRGGERRRRVVWYALWYGAAVRCMLQTTPQKEWYTNNLQVWCTNKWGWYGSCCNLAWEELTNGGGAGREPLDCKVRQGDVAANGHVRDPSPPFLWSEKEYYIE